MKALLVVNFDLEEPTTMANFVGIIATVIDTLIRYFWQG